MMDCACIGPSLKFASVVAADSGPVLHRLCRQRCCATFLAAAVGRREEKSSGDRLHPGGKMTVGAGISIVDGNLMVLGRPVLSRLPDGVILTPHLTSDSWHSAFLGSSALEPSSRHVFSIGTLQGLRFMCGFRFKLWWMTQRMGDCGRDVPMETQFLLLESKALSPSSPHGHLDDLLTVYTVFLPLLEGSFRASLQGSDLDELQLCVESGDAAVESSEARHALFVGVGTDPFAIISEAVRAVEEHSQSFLHREKKKMPGMLDCFGWCTWDAFYTHVTADGVNEGLRSLSEGGTPARFLIIDDGWQSVDTDKGVNAAVTEGTQYASRLSSIRANHKFDERGEEASCLGLQRLIEKAKDDFNLEYVYMWHALAGYWGGVQLNSQEMEQYQPVLTHPVHSPGILFNQPDMAVDSLTVNGLGLVDPQKIYDFYNDLHSYLAKAGVSGVKVDSQSIIETLGQGSGGRVSLAKTYIQALEASIARNFPDNGCISCMSHSSDTIYSTKQTAVIRASDDFWPQDPASHTIHIASVTYNSLFLGEFMQPDWDMFQSLHPAAAYHAAARAVGGCAVYVSDRPGQHDFELLRKLVLPDGTVLRAKLPGRPTLDSIFVDPARDKTSLLKIWNMNSWTGVLGVFNCQGAGWCKVGKKNLIHDTAPDTITGSIHGCDVHLLGLVADGNWNGDCVVYSHQSEEVVRLPRRSALPVTLKVLEFEVYTITPLKKMESGTCFAPIGLLNMFNSGGGIVDLSYDPELELHPPASGAGVSCPHSAQTCPANLQVSEFVRMSVRGCGKFGAYSSRKPRGVFFDSKPSEFSYQEDDGLLTFFLPVPVKGHLWDVRVEL